MVESMPPNEIIHSPFTPDIRNVNPNASYAALKALVKEQGLLEKQSRYVILRAIGNITMFAISVAILFVTDIVWIQAINAIFMGFVFVQFGFIAHDVGHRQAFRTPQTANVMGLFHGPLLLGISFGWWMDKHNQHHAEPNVLDVDPDIDFPFLAFNEEDALRTKGFYRFLVKIQAYIFPIAVIFTSFSLRISSIHFLITETAKKWKHRRLEMVLMALHFVWFFGILFIALPASTALLFIAIQFATFGLYMSSVFAPNHKGMLIIDDNIKLDFMLKQILTARNVRSHPLTDYFYGGLNYQIEHHLFPGMAQNQLRKAQKIIKQYCADNQIPYYETSVVRSYIEILQYLDHISSYLRGSSAQGQPLKNHV